MSGWRQLAGGLAITAVVIIIIGVSLSSAIAQDRLLIEPLAPSRTAMPTGLAPTGVQRSPTETSTAAQTQPSGTTEINPTNCLPPAGWLIYTVQDEDTLASIAGLVGATSDEITAANCLSDSNLTSGMVLYVPMLPQTVTPSATPSGTPSPTASNTASATPAGMTCGPPAGWVLYTVRPGDTLFSLAQATGTTVSLLQFANCLGSSTYIQAGSKIWLPYVPTATPTPTLTPTTTPSPTTTTAPTATPTPPSSATPTATEPPPSSATPSPTSEPPTPTPSETGHPPTPTGTPTEIPASDSICSLNICAPAQ